MHFVVFVLLCSVSLGASYEFYQQPIERSVQTVTNHFTLRYDVSQFCGRPLLDTTVERSFYVKVNPFDERVANGELFAQSILMPVKSVKISHTAFVLRCFLDGTETVDTFPLEDTQRDKSIRVQSGQKAYKFIDIPITAKSDQISEMLLWFDDWQDTEEEETILLESKYSDPTTFSPKKEETGCRLVPQFIRFSEYQGFEHIISPESMVINFCTGSCPNLWVLAQRQGATKEQIWQLFLKGVRPIQVGDSKPICTPSEYEPVLVKVQIGDRIEQHLINDLQATRCECRQ